jgi:hypothetical protein
MPTSTDLVTDLPADFEVFGQAVDTQMKTNADAATQKATLTTTGDIYYASSASTPARLGVGSTGQVLTVAGGVPTWATPASGAITWTQRQNANNGNVQFDSIATNGSTIYVAVGQLGYLYSSTDSGITWASRTSGFGSNQIQSVTYGNGIFVAVGNNGTITSSTDGITWTARTAGVSTNTLNCVEYVNNVFIAVGAGAAGGTGGITTSTDGITWTKRTTPASTSPNLFSIAYGNGYYVAVGQFSTTAGIYSTNFTTWTALPTSLPSTMNYVTYTDNRFVARAGGGQTTYTCGNDPTTTWTGYSQSVPFLATDSTNSLNGQIKLYGSKFYAFVKSNANPLSTALLSFGATYTAGSYQGFEPYYTPIQIPTITTAAGGVFNGTAVAINNSGGIVIGTSNGRLYTSF